MDPLTSKVDVNGAVDIDGFTGAALAASEDLVCVGMSRHGEELGRCLESWLTGSVGSKGGGR